MVMDKSSINWNSRTTVRKFYLEQISMGMNPTNVIREIEKRTSPEKLEWVLRFLTD